MNLARHQISATSPTVILDARFDADANVFTACTPAGFAVYRACPLALLRSRELTGGTLTTAVPLHASNLLFLVGGGRSPRYPPNKVVLWDDARGAEVAELEFRERVRGVAVRRGWLAVALRRRVALFEVGETVTRYGEYDTCDNVKGLLAMATGTHATLLCIPGRQMGHIQLIHLPPCPPPKPAFPPSSPPPVAPPPQQAHPVSIIAAHTSALTALAVPPSGRLVASASARGTLVRVWEPRGGRLVRELRRGSDRAEIFGVAFRADGDELCVWSDKGTVHVFALASSGAANRQSTLSPLAPFLPLPKYFGSEWSYAQYRLPTQSAHITLSQTQHTQPRPAPGEDAPDEERCTVGWTSANELVALTWTGGWYRLGLPSTNAPPVSGEGATGSPPKGMGMGMGASPPRAMSGASRARSGSGSSVVGPDKGKRREGAEKDKEKEAKDSRECVLLEYRRFGRWDGWG